MRRGWEDAIADLREAIDGIERHYAQVKEVALAVAERDPDARLH